MNAPAYGSSFYLDYGGCPVLVTLPTREVLAAEHAAWRSKALSKQSNLRSKA